MTDINFSVRVRVRAFETSDGRVVIPSAEGAWTVVSDVALGHFGWVVVETQANGICVLDSTSAVTNFHVGTLPVLYSQCPDIDVAIMLAVLM